MDKELSQILAKELNPSEKAIHIAARVWYDQDMASIVMDKDACLAIVDIIDDVLIKQKGDKL